MIQKINTNTPLQGVKRTCKVALRKLKFANNKEYDELIISKQNIKPKKSHFDWDAIGRMLTFKI